ncbi:hypothetical protein [Bradyrhizobium guangxiense]|uniref:hypothetical protein n=1 Tax=Bradyrhizobium guangxiense TaxID=1325115 RepID=UPI001008C186|nr:hypothetical protein [Bradyrhizobium guangxiense]
MTFRASTEDRQEIEGMRITPEQLENFATQIAGSEFEIQAHDGIKELIGHLTPDDYDAVLARAAEIVRERVESRSGRPK